MIALDPYTQMVRTIFNLPFLGSYSEWCAGNVRVENSVLVESGSLDLSETSWGIDVLNDCDPEAWKKGITRHNSPEKITTPVFYSTLVKPVQAGGSTFGEAAICAWLFFLKRGEIQYNWPTDQKAKERWKKRFQKILEASKSILALLPNDQTKYQTCLIILERLNMMMQGVDVVDNLASDSVVAQVNEELHNWTPGRLALAYGRTTASQSKWFHILNISNAGKKGDQLHKALLSGTNREWQVKCAGCGLYHAMRTRWEDHRPDLGGLRYDSTGSRREDGTYDYNKLAPTIRYQMPCGFELRDDLKARRALSATGRYSEPRNTGAHSSEESRTLEAVSVHYISWRTLIKEKHDALRDLHFGKPEAWETYQRERECRFVDPNDRPLVQNIVTRPEVKKNRDGLANRLGRFYALDWQRGRKDDEVLDLRNPHWWLLIVDVAAESGRIKIQLVFEGHVLTDGDVLRILDEHGIKKDEARHFGVADCTYDKAKVQAFCFANGINAGFASGSDFFTHNGVKQVYSEEKVLALTLNVALKYPLVSVKSRKGEKVFIEQVPDKREPMFWLFSKFGVMDLFEHLRTAPGIDMIIPHDVSNAFRAHMESWMLDRKQMPDGSIVIDWKQIREADHLYILFGYIAKLLHMAGFIGADAFGQKQTETRQSQ
jgi:hypothetical protein